MSAAPDILIASHEIPQPTPQSNLLSLDLKMAMDPQQQIDFNLNPIAPDTNYLNINQMDHSNADYTKLENMSTNGTAPSTSNTSYDQNTYNQQSSVYDFPSSSYDQPSVPYSENNENNEDEVGKGGEKSENKFLNVEQKKKFQEWIGHHSENLYPTRDEKLGLAKQLNASYLQVTRLLANHRRRLQLQRKRKPANVEEKEDQNSSGDKENRLEGVEENESKKGEESVKTETDRLVMEHVQAVVDEMSGSNRTQNPTNDEDTRMSHVSQLHCDESFEDLDEPNDLPTPPKPITNTTSHSKTHKAHSSSLAERNQRIDFVIDEVVQFVNQMDTSSGQQASKEMVVHQSAAYSGYQTNVANVANVANISQQPKPNSGPTESAVVAEFHRRVATLMRIQQEMRDHRVTKEFEGNYVTPPPSAPLNHNDPILNTNTIAPTPNQPSHTSNSQLPQQNIPISSSSTTTADSTMRRPESSMTMNGLSSTPSLDKHEPTLSQMILDPIQNQYVQQQQLLQNLNSLNLSNLLPQQNQAVPQQQTQSQSAQNLLPLIQKFLAGDFLPGRQQGSDEKLAMNQRAQMNTIQQVQAQQPTGTSLALNQLIGNNSTTSSVATPTQQLSPVVSNSTVPQQLQSSNDSNNMLYPGFQASLNAFAASVAQANPQQFMGNHQQMAQLQQPNIQQPQTITDLFQQALIRQQQNSILSLLQNRDQFAKFASAVNPSGIPDFINVNNLNGCGAMEKAFGMNAGQSNGPSHLMSPPLSSNASSSPRLFSNENAFSDISTCSNSPAPTNDNSFLQPQPIQPQAQVTTPTLPSHTLFATPPSTESKHGTDGKVKKVRKTKKQLKLEKEMQNGENITPISRKRPTTQKRETAKEKKVRLEASIGTAKLKTSPTVVPRKINELTENESIAVAVLAGLSNGRFP